MSKAIRWQLFFAEDKPDDQNPKHYRVDIYDEQDGSWSGITELQGGEKPFVTNEDASEDFFYPVRTQTGTLQVCTLLPGTTNQFITLDELLPANNIARPIRLINLDNSDAIEWQGFLSCEAYSQDYTGIPQILQLPVISVLEAMASVEVDQTKLSGLNTVGATINQLLEIFIDKAGISYFSQYYIPTAARGSNIVGKYIDATVLFKQKEYNNENSTTYIVSGLSLKDCLERISVYMGWCVRENNISLFFMAAKETTGYRRFHRQGQITPGGQIVITWMPDSGSYTPVVTADIATLSWRGTDHQRTVSQGAKSVEVVAKLEKYGLNLGLPEFPYGNVEDYYWKFYWNDWIYIVASLNTSAYSNMFFQYFKGTINIPQNIQTYDGTTTLADVLSRMIASGNNSLGEINIATASSPPFRAIVAAGAFFAQAAYETQEQTAHSTEDGLYCVWLPQAWNTHSHYDPNTGYYYNTDVYEDLGYIFKMNTPLSTCMINGYLRLSSTMTHIIYEYENYEDGGYFIKKTSDWNDKLLLHIKVGDKYWNGSQWTTTQAKVWIDIEGTNFKKNWVPSMPVVETDGFLIPINGVMRGQVEIAIYSPIHAMDQGFQFLAETFFSKLDVDYLVNENSLLSDRSENHYFRLLGTNFRDEISVNTDLASTLNNQPSPSLIMNSVTEAMTELNYGTDQVPDMRRPEVDLLNRLAEYYQAARQRLSLIVEHPTAAPLPLLRLNGISPDTRKYLPLAESRDWIEETCTLTCFETPQS